MKQYIKHFTTQHQGTLSVEANSLEEAEELFLVICPDECIQKYDYYFEDTICVDDVKALAKK